MRCEGVALPTTDLGVPYTSFCQMAEEILQKVEDELNCPVCLDRYKDPKLLQCFHAYCKKCLRTLINRSTAQIPPICPECRQVISVPVKGVEGFTSAFHLERLLGIMQEDHKKEKQHDSEHDDEEVKISCSEHDDEEVKLYCETCQKLICFKCVTKGGEHQGHDHEVLNEALKKYQEEIRSLLELGSKQMAAIDQALNQLGAHRSKIINQQATIETEILEESRKIQITSQLHKITESKLKSLASQEQQLRSIKSQLKGCIDFMKMSNEADNCCDLLNMKRIVVRTIKELTVPIQPNILTRGLLLFRGEDGQAIIII